MDKLGRELTLREVQLISLDIAKNIDRICDEQGLRYYMCFGTLLGAVRHGGFIPWDDDIDLVMPRPDYEKFREYIRRNSSEIWPMKLYSIEDNEKYPYMISRLSDERYIIDVENEDSYGIGIFTDIYPLDGVGQTETEIIKRKNRATKFSSLCYLSTRQKCIRDNTKSKKKIMIKPFAFWISKILGKMYFVRKLNEMVPVYEYDKSNYVGSLVWGSDGPRGIFPSEWLESYVKLKFEDVELRAPMEWDKVLSRLYKNYMELPPEKKRVAHHSYKAYERQSKQ